MMICSTGKKISVIIPPVQALVVDVHIVSVIQAVAVCSTALSTRSAWNLVFAIRHYNPVSGFHRISGRLAHVVAIGMVLLVSAVAATPSGCGRKASSLVFCRTPIAPPLAMSPSSSLAAPATAWLKRRTKTHKDTDNFLVSRYGYPSG
jgi:hypothetical protein